jgi:hypothetical protein
MNSRATTSKNIERNNGRKARIQVRLAMLHTKRARAVKSPRKIISRVSLLILLLMQTSSGALTTSATKLDFTKLELRVLFIGNSLTYSNDLPAIVEALAETAGESRLTYKTVAFPNYSLEDHWNQGDARRAIAEQKWSFVVLQQGPSALPESRSLLIEYARRFAEEIRGSGAKPALYMVWPSESRVKDFDRVRDSYAEAAEKVDAIFIPAGEAWREAWRHKPELALYSPDGLHPTLTGSYLAALVIYQQLYDVAQTSLPSRLKLRSGKVSKIELSRQEAELLQAAAARATASARQR